MGPLVICIYLIFPASTTDLVSTQPLTAESFAIFRCRLCRNSSQPQLPGVLRACPGLYRVCWLYLLVIRKIKPRTRTEPSPNATLSTTYSILIVHGTKPGLRGYAELTGTRTWWQHVTNSVNYDTAHKQYRHLKSTVKIVHSFTQNPFKIKDTKPLYKTSYQTPIKKILLLQTCPYKTPFSLKRSTLRKNG